MNVSEAAYSVLQDSRELIGAAEPLTRQEDRYVKAWISGMTPKDAISYAGLPADWAPTPGVEAAIHTFRQEETRAALITKERLTMMFLESHAKAVQVADEIKATVELGKLHGLYESDKQRNAKGGAVQVNNIISGSKMDRMSDAELLIHAALDEQSLDLPPPESTETP